MYRYMTNLSYAKNNIYRYFRYLSVYDQPLLYRTYLVALTDISDIYRYMTNLSYTECNIYLFRFLSVWPTSLIPNTVRSMSSSELANGAKKGTIAFADREREKKK